MLPGMAERVFSASITGNVTAQNMLNALSNVCQSLNGILTDVFVDLGTATTVAVEILENGRSIFLKTGIVADAHYKVDDAAIVENGVAGVLTVTTTAISNAAHTLTVRAKVREPE